MLVARVPLASLPVFIATFPFLSPRSFLVFVLYSLQNYQIGGTLRTLSVSYYRVRFVIQIVVIFFL